MKSLQKISAVLFDFDGVVMDTESQYSEFWDKQGAKYINITDFGMLLKGFTLEQTFNKYFKNKPEIQKLISSELISFEKNMNYKYITGFLKFIIELKELNITTGLVTSSGLQKMEKVFSTYPDFRAMFDIIITANDFSRSKPDPECYLLAIKKLDIRSQDTFIFEDSIHGLEAAMNSKAIVVGLTTTNSYAKIFERAHYIIKDFNDVNFGKLMEWRSHKD